MAGRIKFRGGTTAEHSVFTGSDREITVDITKKTLVVHDGINAGGSPLATEESVNNVIQELENKVDINENITTQGNLFNGLDQLVKLDSSGKLPAIDGSQLTGVSSGSLVNSGVSAGTYKSVTVNSKGIITAGTNPTTLSGYGITDADTSAQVTTKINNAVAALVDASPTTLDTLNELAAALGDDPNFATTTSTALGNRVVKNADIVAGTGTKVTYDAKGLVTSSTTPTTLAGYSISDAYTKTEVNNSLALKVDDSEIASVNLLRADKYLAAQNIANMLYTSGDLTKIRYKNDSDVDYEILSYASGNLTSINHYIGGVLKGTTTLSYSGGNLVSAVFVEI